jgi:predicted DNA-binding transcriptional regulator AlpA
VEQSERRSGDRRRSLTTSAVTSLTATLAELLKQLSDRTAANELTANVEEAARLLKTTRGGIYAMHARGQLPKPLGPGRRLIWRTADLLACRDRRAPSAGKARGAFR